MKLLIVQIVAFVFAVVVFFTADAGFNLFGWWYAMLLVPAPIAIGLGMHRILHGEW